MTVLEAWSVKRKARERSSDRAVTRGLAETISTTARATLGAAGRARTRLRRPMLTVGGLGCIDAAFFQHGWFAGLLATGISAFVFEALSGGEEQ